MTSDDRLQPEEARDDEPIISPDEQQDETPTATEPPADAPASPVPGAPRILSETPLGGKPPMTFPSRATPAPQPEPEPEPAPVQDEAPSIQAEEPIEAAVETAETPAVQAVPEAATTPEPEPEAPAPVQDEAPPAEDRARLRTEPAPPPAPPADEIAGADDWDDDISPELAAVLFGGRRKPEAQPERRAESPAAASAPETAPAEAPARPAIESAPPAAPIHLTDVAEARTLPITAGGLSSPPPSVQPEGKARYQRIEEPLRDDGGQRTVETWDYLGPDRPAAGGRAIKRVQIEEIAFSDGSWRWKWERRYDDGGRDRREIRADSAREFVERKDELKLKDAATGQRITQREHEAMILAGQPQADKRSFFRRLFRRHDETPDTGPKSWRAATANEVSRARKQGGSAF